MSDSKNNGAPQALEINCRKVVARVNAVPNHKHKKLKEVVTSDLMKETTKIWPHEADVEFCYDARGNKWKVLGKSSATWFRYGGGGSQRSFKIQKLYPTNPIIIVATGDMCPGTGCCIGRVRYTVEEKAEKDGKWREISKYSAPESSLCIQRWHVVVPAAAEIRILARGSFYFDVYQPNINFALEKKEETIDIDAYKKLFSDKLMTKTGEVNTVDHLKGKTHVLVYFSASWCHNCRDFTPQFAKWYKEFIKSEKGKKAEVIFQSLDSNENDFKRYFKGMPWVALPFEKMYIKQENSNLKSWGVSGIPTIVVLGPDGKIITKEGRMGVSQDIELGSKGKNFPWPATVNK